MQLRDSVALVTGSSRGIGLAVAHRLRSRGARVILHGRDVAALAGLAAEVGAGFLAADLAEPAAAADLAERALAEYGRVDVVVHSAGVGWFGRFAEMPVQRLDRVLRLDLQAPMELTRALLPAMLERGRGHVSFVGSIAGLTGVANEAAYSAAKAGLIAFADSVRLELAASAITVSTVNPGAVATGFFAERGADYDRAVPRPVPAQRVADVIVHAIENDRPRAVVPRWLALAPAVRAVAPATYDALARRLG